MPGRRFIGWLMVCVLSSGGALGAIVTVQFAGQVTGSSNFGLRAGSWMTGCFTYDSDADRLQSATGPNFVISVPEENFHLQRTFYALGVQDNWRMPPDPTLSDGLLLEFSYPSGYGVLGLSSSDVSLFTGTKLPTSVPRVERFDLGKTVYIRLDAIQPEGHVAMRIDHLHQIPANAESPRLTWSIAGEDILFQFSGEPTTTYLVEAADSLSQEGWEQIDEVAGIAGGFRIKRNAEGHRFFRLRAVPCECL